MPKYDNTPRGRSFFRSSYFEQSTISKIFEIFFYLVIPAALLVALIIGIVANYS
jgi:hypothetical protein